MRNNNQLSGWQLSGWFLLAFLAYAGFAASMAAVRAAAQLETPGFTTFARGEWARAYEKKFDEALPGAGAGTGLWAALNYKLFGMGKSGVLIGADGWLFTAEEFAWPADARERISIRAADVGDVKRKLDAQGIRLIAALIPAKARICGAHLGRYSYPSYNQPVYESFRRAMMNNGINAPDILSAMKKKDCDDLFLRTDTHWKSQGARMAAQEIAAAAGLKYNTRFRMAPAQPISYQGDLSRYVPGQVGPEYVKSYTSIKEGGKQTEEALFGDEKIPVALVGTSYSANPLWSFAVILGHELQTEIVNAADEGRGPFETMEAYLASVAFRDNPPELVVWEIPERYLVMDAERKAP